MSELHWAAEQELGRLFRARRPGDHAGIGQLTLRGTPQGKWLQLGATATLYLYATITVHHEVCIWTDVPEPLVQIQLADPTALDINVLMTTLARGLDQLLRQRHCQLDSCWVGGRLLYYDQQGQLLEYCDGVTTIRYPGAGDRQSHPGTAGVPADAGATGHLPGV